MSVLVVLFVSAIVSCCCRLGSSAPRLLLVSFDGFRADYLETYNLPHLQEFIEDGVFVKQVTNAFITKTFPNHYSIVTGLYEESHGIVANDMYDPEAKKKFSQFNDSDPFWWNEAVPIWVTNQQQNGTSAAAMWPGTDVRINNTTPRFFMKYNFSVTFEERVEKIMNWLNSSDPLVNFATLYWEEPDVSGHKYGPDDTENMRRVLEQVDQHVGFLTSKLKASGLWDSINVIITSDHGMAQCSPKKLIVLDNCIGRGNYTLIDRTPVAAVLPKNNKKYVYNLLKQCDEHHMKVYLKEEIPDRFHYRHNGRIQPIILIADEGWTIVQNEALSKLGDHGYDNSLPSMHPFLAAHGPAFRRGYRQSTINNVDIYPMMCHILGLAAQPHNGTLSHTKCLLADQWCLQLPEAVGIVTGGLLVLTTFTCVVIMVTKNRVASPRPFSRLQLQSDDDDPLIG